MNRRAENMIIREIYMKQIRDYMNSSIQITYDTYVHTDFEQLKQIVTAI